MVVLHDYVICLSLALQMGDDRRRAMYDGFSDTLGHSNACVKVAEEFMERVFAGELSHPDFRKIQMHLVYTP